ncbi:MAG TPA: PfkB family carbohydrate kinase [Candidatus Omnitrophota bacterium]|nr:PfkB family carbohydrate kinase [Candidatus Omnitrophota bacterium]
MASKNSQNLFHQIILKKIIALAVIFFFFVTDLFSFPSHALAQNSRIAVQGGTPTNGLQRQAHVGKIIVPPELGSIDEIYKDPGAAIQGLGQNSKEMEIESRKLVIFIQDAHDSLEAQENIAKLISHLVQKEGVRTVFEEGYEGAVPTGQYFGFIKERELRQKVSYFFLDRLRIGGAEYAHINRTEDFKLIGADSIQLHKENVDEYRYSAEKKASIQKDLQALDHELQSLVTKRFSKKLCQWLKIKDRFDNKKLDLLDYFSRTMDLLMGGNKNPLSVGAAVPLIRFLLEAKQSHDPAVFEKVKHIDAREIYEELGKLEEVVKKNYLQNDTDNELFQYYKILQLLKRLNDLEVTQEEYEAVKSSLVTFNTESLGRFIHQNIPKPLVLSKQWEQNIQDAIHFYEIAKARDAAVDSQLDTFLQSKDETTAVLVFGGFHKENIKRILEAKNVSYAVVSPRITKTSPRHQGYYKHLMTKGRLPFEIPFQLATATRALSIFVEGFGQSEVRAIEQAASRHPDVDVSLLDRYLSNQRLQATFRSEIRFKNLTEFHSNAAAMILSAYQSSDPVTALRELLPQLVSEAVRLNDPGLTAKALRQAFGDPSLKDSDDTKRRAFTDMLRKVFTQDLPAPEVSQVSVSMTGSENTPRIWTIGNLAFEMDIQKKLQDWSDPKGVVVQAGGGNINIARALKYSLENVRTTPVFFYGGETGVYLQKILASEGINTEAGILLEGGKSNYVMVAMGVSKEEGLLAKRTPVSTVDWQKLVARLMDPVHGVKPGDLVTISSVPPTGLSSDVHAKLTKRLVEERRARVIVDTVGESGLKIYEEGKAEIFSMNHSGFIEFVKKTTGETIDPDDVSLMIRKAQELLERKKESFGQILVTLAEKGALLVTHEKAFYVPNPESLKIVTDIGAGDAARAAVVLGTLRNEDPKNLLIHAVAAGASSVEMAGTGTWSPVHAKQHEAWIAQHMVEYPVRSELRTAGSPKRERVALFMDVFEDLLHQIELKQRYEKEGVISLKERKFMDVGMFPGFVRNYKRSKSGSSDIQATDGAYDCAIIFSKWGSHPTFEWQMYHYYLNRSNEDDPDRMRKDNVNDMDTILSSGGKMVAIFYDEQETIYEDVVQVFSESFSHSENSTKLLMVKTPGGTAKKGIAMEEGIGIDIGSTRLVLTWEELEGVMGDQPSATLTLDQLIEARDRFLRSPSQSLERSEVRMSTEASSIKPNINPSDNEWIDVVDENDQVVRQIRRGDSRKSLEPVRHRAIHIIPVSPGGEILFQKRSYYKSGAGVLDTAVAGAVQAGETYQAGAVREAQEELPFSFEEGQLYPVYPSKEQAFFEYVTQKSLLHRGLFLMRLTAAQKEAVLENNKRLTKFWKEVYEEISAQFDVSVEELKTMAVNDQSNVRATIRQAVIQRVGEQNLHFYEAEQFEFIPFDKAMKLSEETPSLIGNGFYGYFRRNQSLKINDYRIVFEKALREFINTSRSEMRGFNSSLRKSILYVLAAGGLLISSTVGFAADSVRMFIQKGPEPDQVTLQVEAPPSFNSATIEKTSDFLNFTPVAQLSLADGQTTWTQTVSTEPSARDFFRVGANTAMILDNPLFAHSELLQLYRDTSQALLTLRNNGVPVNQTTITGLPSTFWTKSSDFRWMWSSDLLMAMNHDRYPVTNFYNPSQVISDPAAVQARLLDSMRLYSSLVNSFGLRVNGTNTGILPEVLLPSGNYFVPERKAIPGTSPVIYGVSYSAFDMGLTTEELMLLEQVLEQGLVKGLHSPELLALIKSELARTSYRVFAGPTDMFFQTVWKSDDGRLFYNGSMINNKHTEARFFLTLIYAGYLGDPALPLEERIQQGLAIWRAMSLNYQYFRAGNKMLAIGRGDVNFSGFTEYSSWQLFDPAAIAPLSFGTSATNYPLIAKHIAGKLGHSFFGTAPGTDVNSSNYRPFGLLLPSVTVPAGTDMLLSTGLDMALQNKTNLIAKAKAANSYVGGWGLYDAHNPVTGARYNNKRIYANLGLQTEFGNYPLLRYLTRKMPWYSFVADELHDSDLTNPAPLNLPVDFDMAASFTSRGRIGSQAGTSQSMSTNYVWTIHYSVDPVNNLAGAYGKFNNFSVTANSVLRLHLGAQVSPQKMKVELKQNGAIRWSGFTPSNLQPFQIIEFPITGYAGPVNEITFVVDYGTVGSNKSGTFSVTDLYFFSPPRSEMRSSIPEKEKPLEKIPVGMETKLERVQKIAIYLMRVSFLFLLGRLYLDMVGKSGNPFIDMPLKIPIWLSVSGIAFGYIFSAILFFLIKKHVGEEWSSGTQQLISEKKSQDPIISETEKDNAGQAPADFLKKQDESTPSERSEIRIALNKNTKIPDIAKALTGLPGLEGKDKRRAVARKILEVATTAGDKLIIADLQKIKELAGIATAELEKRFHITQAAPRAPPLSKKTVPQKNFLSFKTMIIPVALAAGVTAAVWLWNTYSPIARAYQTLLEYKNQVPPIPSTITRPGAEHHSIRWHGARMEVIGGAHGSDVGVAALLKLSKNEIMPHPKKWVLVTEGLLDAQKNGKEVLVPDIRIADYLNRTFNIPVEDVIPVLGDPEVVEILMKKTGLPREEILVADMFPRFHDFLSMTAKLLAAKGVGPDRGPSFDQIFAAFLETVRVLYQMPEPEIRRILLKAANDASNSNEVLEKFYGQINLVRVEMLKARNEIAAQRLKALVVKYPGKNFVVMIGALHLPVVGLKSDSFTTDVRLPSQSDIQWLANDIITHSRSEMRSEPVAPGAPRARSELKTESDKFTKAMKRVEVLGNKLTTLISFREDGPGVKKLEQLVEENFFSRRTNFLRSELRMNIKPISEDPFSKNRQVHSSRRQWLFRMGAGAILLSAACWFTVRNINSKNNKKNLPSTSKSMNLLGLYFVNHSSFDQIQPAFDKMDSDIAEYKRIQAGDPELVFFLEYVLSEEGLVQLVEHFSGVKAKDFDDLIQQHRELVEKNYNKLFYALSNQESIDRFFNDTSQVFGQIVQSLRKKYGKRIIFVVERVPFEVWLRCCKAQRFREMVRLDENGDISREWLKNHTSYLQENALVQFPRDEAFNAFMVDVGTRIFPSALKFTFRGLGHRINESLLGRNIKDFRPEDISADYIVREIEQRIRDGADLSSALTMASYYNDNFASSATAISDIRTFNLVTNEFQKNLLNLANESPQAIKKILIESVSIDKDMQHESSLIGKEIIALETSITQKTASGQMVVAEDIKRFSQLEGEFWKIYVAGNERLLGLSRKYNLISQKNYNLLLEANRQLYAKRKVEIFSKLEADLPMGIRQQLPRSEMRAAQEKSETAVVISRFRIDFSDARELQKDLEKIGIAAQAPDAEYIQFKGQDKAVAISDFQALVLAAEKAFGGKLNISVKKDPGSGKNILYAHRGKYPLAASSAEELIITLNRVISAVDLSKTAYLTHSLDITLPKNPAHPLVRELAGWVNHPGTLAQKVPDTDMRKVLLGAMIREHAELVLLDAFGFDAKTIGTIRKEFTQKQPVTAEKLLRFIHRTSMKKTDALMIWVKKYGPSLVRAVINPLIPFYGVLGDVLGEVGRGIADESSGFLEKERDEAVVQELTLWPVLIRTFVELVPEKIPMEAAGFPPKVIQELKGLKDPIVTMAGLDDLVNGPRFKDLKAATQQGILTCLLSVIPQLVSLEAIGVHPKIEEELGGIRINGFIEDGIRNVNELIDAFGNPEKFRLMELPPTTVRNLLLALLYAYPRHTLASLVAPYAGSLTAGDLIAYLAPEPVKEFLFPVLRPVWNSTLDELKAKFMGAEASIRSEMRSTDAITLDLTQEKGHRGVVELPGGMEGRIDFGSGGMYTAKELSGIYLTFKRDPKGAVRVQIIQNGNVKRQTILPGKTGRVIEIQGPMHFDEKVRFVFKNEPNSFFISTNSHWNTTLHYWHATGKFQESSGVFQTPDIPGKVLSKKDNVSTGLKSLGAFKRLFLNLALGFNIYAVGWWIHAFWDRRQSAILSSPVLEMSKETAAVGWLTVGLGTLSIGILSFILYKDFRNSWLISRFKIPKREAGESPRVPPSRSEVRMDHPEHLQLKVRAIAPALRIPSSKTGSGELTLLRLAQRGFTPAEFEAAIVSGQPPEAAVAALHGLRHPEHYWQALRVFFVRAALLHAVSWLSGGREPSVETILEAYLVLRREGRSDQEIFEFLVRRLNNNKVKEKLQATLKITAAQVIREAIEARVWVPEFLEWEQKLRAVVQDDFFTGMLEAQYAPGDFQTAAETALRQPQGEFARSFQQSFEALGIKDVPNAGILNVLRAYYLKAYLAHQKISTDENGTEQPLLGGQTLERGLIVRIYADLRSEGKNDQQVYEFLELALRTQKKAIASGQKSIAVVIEEALKARSEVRSNFRTERSGFQTAPVRAEMRVAAEARSELRSEQPDREKAFITRVLEAAREFGFSGPAALAILMKSIRPEQPARKQAQAVRQVSIEFPMNTPLPEAYQKWLRGEANEPEHVLILKREDAKTPAFVLKRENGKTRDFYFDTFGHNNILLIPYSTPQTGEVGFQIFLTALPVTSQPVKIRDLSLNKDQMIGGIQVKDQRTFLPEPKLWRAAKGSATAGRVGAYQFSDLLSRREGAAFERLMLIALHALTTGQIRSQQSLSTDPLLATYVQPDMIVTLHDRRQILDAKRGKGFENIAKSIMKYLLARDLNPDVLDAGVPIGIVALSSQEMENIRNSFSQFEEGKDYELILADDLVSELATMFPTHQRIGGEQGLTVEEIRQKLGYLRHEGAGEPTEETLAAEITMLNVIIGNLQIPSNGKKPVKTVKELIEIGKTNPDELLGYVRQTESRMDRFGERPLYTQEQLVVLQVNLTEIQAALNAVTGDAEWIREHLAEHEKLREILAVIDALISKIARRINLPAAAVASRERPGIKVASLASKEPVNQLIAEPLKATVPTTAEMKTLSESPKQPVAPAQAIETQPAPLPAEAIATKAEVTAAPALVAPKPETVAKPEKPSKPKAPRPAREQPQGKYESKVNLHLLEPGTSVYESVFGTHQQPKEPLDAVGALSKLLRVWTKRLKPEQDGILIRVQPRNRQAARQWEELGARSLRQHFGNRIADSLSSQTIHLEGIRGESPQGVSAIRIPISEPLDIPGLPEGLDAIHLVEGTGQGFAYLMRNTPHFRLVYERIQKPTFNFNDFQFLISLIRTGELRVLELPAYGFFTAEDMTSFIMNADLPQDIGAFLVSEEEARMIHEKKMKSALKKQKSDLVAAITQEVAAARKKLETALDSKRLAPGALVKLDAAQVKAIEAKIAELDALKIVEELFAIRSELRGDKQGISLEDARQALAEKKAVIEAQINALKLVGTELELFVHQAETLIKKGDQTAMNNWEYPKVLHYQEIRKLTPSDPVIQRLNDLTLSMILEFNEKKDSVSGDFLALMYGMMAVISAISIANEKSFFIEPVATVLKTSDLSGLELLLHATVQLLPLMTLSVSGGTLLTALCLSSEQYAHDRRFKNFVHNFAEMEMKAKFQNKGIIKSDQHRRYLARPEVMAEAVAIAETEYRKAEKPSAQLVVDFLMGHLAANANVEAMMHAMAGRVHEAISASEKITITIDPRRNYEYAREWFEKTQRADPNYPLWGRELLKDQTTENRGSLTAQLSGVPLHKRIFSALLRVPIRADNESCGVLAGALDIFFEVLMNEENHFGQSAGLHSKVSKFSAEHKVLRTFVEKTIAKGNPNYADVEAFRKRMAAWLELAEEIIGAPEFSGDKEKIARQLLKVRKAFTDWFAKHQIPFARIPENPATGNQEYIVVAMREEKSGRVFVGVPSATDFGKEVNSAAAEVSSAEVPVIFMDRDISSLMIEKGLTVIAMPRDSFMAGRDTEMVVFPQSLSGATLESIKLDLQPANKSLAVTALENARAHLLEIQIEAFKRSMEFFRQAYEMLQNESEGHPASREDELTRSFERLEKLWEQVSQSKPASGKSVVPFLEEVETHRKTLIGILQSGVVSRGKGERFLQDWAHHSASDYQFIFPKVITREDQRFGVIGFLDAAGDYYAASREASNRYVYINTAHPGSKPLRFRGGIQEIMLSGGRLVLGRLDTMKAVGEKETAVIMVAQVEGNAPIATRVLNAFLDTSLTLDTESGLLRETNISLVQAMEILRKTAVAPDQREAFQTDLMLVQVSYDGFNEALLAALGQGTVPYREMVKLFEKMASLQSDFETIQERNPSINKQQLNVFAKAALEKFLEWSRKQRVPFMGLVSGAEGKNINLVIGFLGRDGTLYIATQESHRFREVTDRADAKTVSFDNLPSFVRDEGMSILAIPQSALLEPRPEYIVFYPAVELLPSQALASDIPISSESAAQKSEPKSVVFPWDEMELVPAAPEHSQAVYEAFYKKQTFAVDKEVALEGLPIAEKVLAQLRRMHATQRDPFFRAATKGFELMVQALRTAAETGRLSVKLSNQCRTELEPLYSAKNVDDMHKASALKFLLPFAEFWKDHQDALIKRVQGINYRDQESELYHLQGVLGEDGKLYTTTDAMDTFVEITDAAEKKTISLPGRQGLLKALQEGKALILEIHNPMLKPEEMEARLTNLLMLRFKNSPARSEVRGTLTQQFPLGTIEFEFLMLHFLTKLSEDTGYDSEIRGDIFDPPEVWGKVTAEEMDNAVDKLVRAHPAGIAGEEQVSPVSYLFDQTGILVFDRASFLAAFDKMINTEFFDDLMEMAEGFEQAFDDFELEDPRFNVIKAYKAAAERILYFKYHRSEVRIDEAKIKQIVDELLEGDILMQPVDVTNYILRLGPYSSPKAGEVLKSVFKKYGLPEEGSGRSLPPGSPEMKLSFAILNEMIERHRKSWNVEPPGGETQTQGPARSEIRVQTSDVKSPVRFKDLMGSSSVKSSPIPSQDTLLIQVGKYLQGLPEADLNDILHSHGIMFPEGVRARLLKGFKDSTLKQTLLAKFGQTLNQRGVIGLAVSKDWIKRLTKSDKEYQVVWAGKDGKLYLLREFYEYLNNIPNDEERGKVAAALIVRFLIAKEFRQILREEEMPLEGKIRESVRAVEDYVYAARAIALSESQVDLRVRGFVYLQMYERKERFTRYAVPRVDWGSRIIRLETLLGRLYTLRDLLDTQKVVKTEDRETLKDIDESYKLDKDTEVLIRENLQGKSIEQLEEFQKQFSDSYLKIKSGIATAVRKYREGKITEEAYEETKARLNRLANIRLNKVIKLEFVLMMKLLDNRRSIRKVLDSLVGHFEEKERELKWQRIRELQKRNVTEVFVRSASDDYLKVKLLKDLVSRQRATTGAIERIESRWNQQETYYLATIKQLFTALIDHESAVTQNPALWKTKLLDYFRMRKVDFKGKSDSAIGVNDIAAALYLRPDVAQDVFLRIKAWTRQKTVKEQEERVKVVSQLVRDLIPDEAKHKEGLERIKYRNLFNFFRSRDHVVANYDTEHRRAWEAIGFLTDLKLQLRHYKKEAIPSYKVRSAQRDLRQVTDWVEHGKVSEKTRIRELMRVAQENLQLGQYAVTISKVEEAQSILENDFLVRIERMSRFVARHKESVNSELGAPLSMIRAGIKHRDQREFKKALTALTRFQHRNIEGYTATEEEPGYIRAKTRFTVMIKALEKPFAENRPVNPADLRVVLTNLYRVRYDIQHKYEKIAEIGTEADKINQEVTAKVTQDLALARSEMREQLPGEGRISPASRPGLELREASEPTINVNTISNIQEPVVFVIEQAKIDQLTPEMFKELLALAAINKERLHVVIPDALQGKFSARVGELKTIAHVYYGNLPEVAKSQKVKVIGFSQSDENVEILKARFGERIAGRTSAYFTTEQTGSFAVALLYAIQNIKREQLKVKNGYFYDGTGWLTSRALEILWNSYTVISSAA